MTLLDPQNLAALATLTVLEIVLGIDNIVFIAVSAARLPKEQQAAARRLGLAFALFTRLALLGAIAWIAQLTAPIAEVLGQTVSWRPARRPRQELRRGGGPDRRHRHRVFPRFRHHGGRHGGGLRDHGHRDLAGDRR